MRTSAAPGCSIRHVVPRSCTRGRCEPVERAPVCCCSPRSTRSCSRCRWCATSPADVVEPVGEPTGPARPPGRATSGRLKRSVIDASGAAGGTAPALRPALRVLEALPTSPSPRASRTCPGAGLELTGDLHYAVEHRPAERRPQPRAHHPAAWACAMRRGCSPSAWASWFSDLTLRAVRRPPGARHPCTDGRLELQHRTRARQRRSRPTIRNDRARRPRLRCQRRMVFLLRHD